MSQPSPGVPPFRVVYSGVCRDATRQLLTRAAAKGRFAELAKVVRDIHTRLKWIPLDFGEPFRYFAHLGIQLYIAPLAPLVVTYGVDEAKRIVYVAIPFKLLPQSGL